MQRKVFLLFAVAVLCCSFPLMAQKRRGGTSAAVTADNISINVSFPASPRIGYDKQEGEYRSDNRWMQIRIQYRFNNSYRAGFTFDNMRCDVYLYTIASKGAWVKNFWFTGTQHFYSVIPGRSGTVHQVLMFMPPPLLYKATGGAKVSTKFLKDCIIFVRFYNGEKLLGRKIWAGAGKGGKMDRRQGQLARNVFRRMNDNPANKFVNGLWPQEKTPWQWLGADRMDLPKMSFGNERTSVSVKNEEAEEEEDGENQQKNSNKNENKEDTELEDTPGEIEFTRTSGSKNRNKRRKK